MLVISGQNDPYVNLSIEEALFGACKTQPSLRGALACRPLMYLWINAPSVIIGRNQNIWRECRLDEMERDGVLPVRRDTGGGAVYHDLGNLLFSFILPEGTDTDYSYGVCLRAMRSLGIDAAQQGRNDMVAQGRKFSGSAYMKSGGAILHHGTMLVCSDLDRLSRYLAPSKTKLAAKGVKSTLARVVNLREIKPDVTVEQVMAALMEAFGEDKPVELESLVDMKQVEEMAARRRSWEFLYGLTPPFDAQLETRLSFGEIKLHLSLRRGVICAAKVYTDALDTQIAADIEGALLGRAMDARSLAQAARGVNEEVAGWLEGAAL